MMMIETMIMMSTMMEVMMIVMMMLTMMIMIVMINMIILKNIMMTITRVNISLWISGRGLIMVGLPAHCSRKINESWLTKCRQIFPSEFLFDLDKKMLAFSQMSSPMCVPSKIKGQFIISGMIL